MIIYNKIRPRPVVLQLVICAFLFCQLPALPQTPANTQNMPLPSVRVVQNGHQAGGARVPAAPMKFNLPPAAGSSACDNPPTASDLHPFGGFQAMSVKDSASLNLTFVASGSVSFTDNSQVVVYRLGDTATCPSSDGKYMLTYGNEIDGAVAITQTTLTGSASFATIAANVQINNSNTAYNWSGAGFQADSKLTAWQTDNVKVLQDVSANLTVSNFSTFSTDWNTALNAGAALTTNTTPRVIAYAPVGISGLAEDLASGYALMFIAQGRGCLDAVAAFPTKSSSVEAAIRKVYSQLSAGKSDCDANADPTEQSLAHQLLNGVKIDNP
jgi:hypothetical protein